MEQNQEIWEEYSIHNLSRYTGVNEVATYEKISSISEMWPFLGEIEIYPNRHVRGKQDYVSVVIKQPHDDGTVDGLRCIYSLNEVSYIHGLFVTLSIVDNEKNLKLEHVYKFDPNQDSMFHEFDVIERSVLMEKRGELLPKDTLTIRLAITFVHAVPFEYFFDLQDVAVSDFWFIKKSDTSLDLSNPDILKLIKKRRDSLAPWDKLNREDFSLYLRKDSSLCKALQKKSKFFRGLLRSTFEEKDYGFYHFPKEKFLAFYHMLCYIYFESTEHIYLNLQWIKVFEEAIFYKVPELQAICREHLKQEMDIATALDITELCADANLCSSAIRHILLHWNNFSIAEKSRALCKPELAERVLHNARLLHFDSNTTLKQHAYREVIRNWKIVVHQIRFKGQPEDHSKEIERYLKEL